jgi:hypothetical protein
VDERVQKAFDNANYMATLVSQKNILNEELAQSLLYYENGGTFTASKELINFTKTLLDIGYLENVVLVDDNNTPINIEDLKVFFDKIISTYFEAVNEFYNKHNALIKQRKIESLIDLYD